MFIVRSRTTRSLLGGGCCYPAPSSSTSSFSWLACHQKTPPPPSTCLSSSSSSSWSSSREPRSFSSFSFSSSSSFSASVLPFSGQPVPLQAAASRRKSTLQTLHQRLIRPFTSTAPPDPFATDSQHKQQQQQQQQPTLDLAHLDRRIRIFPRPMPRSYGDAVDKLNSLQSNIAVLEAIRKSRGSANNDAIPEMIEFVHRAGYNPEDFDDMNLIHVTGTKGKGSTCAFTESILRNYEGKEKIKTGLYTSPHIMEVRERIRINGVPISQDLFAKYFFEVWDRLDNTGDKSKPGYFRFLTVVAFHVFKQEKVKVAILEVGVGGSFDSTNIILKPVVCAVAALGIDHVTVLGSTLGEIAWNKGGIFKKNVPALSCEQPEEGLSVLQDRAKELGTSVQIVPAFTKEALGEVTLGLAGNHQLANAALASSICRIWVKQVLGDEITLSENTAPKEFIKGLSSVHWPGRGEIMIRKDKPKITWFFDGAHTAESIHVCAAWFKDASQSNAQGSVKRVLLFNCTGPRDGQTLLGPLAKFQSTVHFDHAVFAPTITFASNTYLGDLLNSNAPPDPDLKAQKTLEAHWIEQVRSAADSDEGRREDVKTTVLPSIEHSVNWIDDYVKSESGVNQVQVLVTGSLHFVGGVQSVLGCEVV